MSSQPSSGAQRSPRRGLCAAVLSLEGLTLALSTFVMRQIADVAWGVAIGLGCGLAVACFVVAGLLRHEWSYWLGWVIQAWAVALGFVVPAMFALGLIFGILWGAAVWLGRKIDRERAEAWAAYEAEQAQQRDAAQRDEQAG